MRLVRGQLDVESLPDVFRECGDLVATVEAARRRGECDARHFELVDEEQVRRVVARCSASHRRSRLEASEIVRAFVVSYDAAEPCSGHGMHLDPGVDITINVALTDNSEGGELCFDSLGGGCFLRQAGRGAALVHEGQRRHGACPMTRGRRHNLIIWLRVSLSFSWPRLTVKKSVVGWLDVATACSLAACSIADKALVKAAWSESGVSKRIEELKTKAEASIVEKKNSLLPDDLRREMRRARVANFVSKALRQESPSVIFDLASERVRVLSLNKEPCCLVRPFKRYRAFEGALSAETVRELSLDCVVAAPPFVGADNTFWISSGEEPRCAIEAHALAIYRSLTDDRGSVDLLTEGGAEWWVQRRERGEEPSRASVSSIESDASAGGGGDLETVGFHWDDAFKRSPEWATVTYLCDAGAPTVVAPMKQHGETPAMEICVCPPRKGRVFAFDGSFLHAAPAEYSLRKLCSSDRLTLLVNVWRERPVGPKRLEQLAAQSMTPPRCSLSFKYEIAIETMQAEDCAERFYALREKPRQALRILTPGNLTDLCANKDSFAPVVLAAAPGAPALASYVDLPCR